VAPQDRLHIPEMMVLMTSVRLATVLICLALVCPEPLHGQAIAKFDEGAEALVFRELNESRIQAGLPALRLDPGLTSGARQHSALMEQHHRISHQFDGEASLSDRVRAHGVLFTKAAENVGMNSDLDNVTEMFLDSPGHRANMLSGTYNAVGVGVVHAGSAYWITEDFVAEPPSLSADEAGNQVAVAFDAQWKRLHPVPLKRVTLPGLRAIACEAARQRKIPVKTVIYDRKEAQQVLAYSTSDPSVLTSQISIIVGMNHLTAYAVAACTPKESGDTGQFWVVMPFF